MKRLVGLLTVFVVGLSACGSGGGNANGQTPTSVKQSSSTTIAYTWPPVTIKANNTDITHALDTVLRVDDFPSGWNNNGKGSTSQPNDLALDEAFVQCMFGATPSTASVYLVSPLMANADGTQVAQSFTRVVGSKEDARKDFSSFNADRASKCQQAMYQRQVDEPKSVGKKFGAAAPDAIPVSSISPPDGSNDVIALRIFISPRDKRSTYIDMFAYGNKRFETVILFQSQNGNPPSGVESTVLKNVKDRVIQSAT